jgi:hypothetical protein
VFIGEAIDITEEIVLIANFVGSIAIISAIIGFLLIFYSTWSLTGKRFQFYQKILIISTLQDNTFKKLSINYRVYLVDS